MISLMISQSQIRKERNRSQFDEIASVAFLGNANKLCVFQRIAHNIAQLHIF